MIFIIVLVYHIQNWQSAAHPKQKIYTTYVFDETLNLSFSIICHSIEKISYDSGRGNLGEVSGTPILWQTDPHCLSQQRAVFCESLKHKTTNDYLQGNQREVNMVVIHTCIIQSIHVTVSDRRLPLLLIFDLTIYFYIIASNSIHTIYTVKFLFSVTYFKKECS